MKSSFRSFRAAFALVAVFASVLAFTAPASAGVSALPLECNLSLTPTLEGDDGPNTLRGTPGDDIIFGYGGNDKIFGLGGNDIICGGDGNDRVDGGAGSDTLYGGDNNDRLYGRGGNDFMFGNDGNDYMAGANGNDEMHGQAGNDRMFGQNNNDTMYGSTGDDVLNGGRNTDIVDGGTPEPGNTETNRCVAAETETNCGTVTTTVIDENDDPVLQTLGTAFDVDENTTAVTDVNSTDMDGETDNGGGLTYSLSGDDAAAFQIDAGGAVSFNNAPDFETPSDLDANNEYLITLAVTDSQGATDSEDLVTTVLDVNEAPMIIGFDSDPAPIDYDPFVPLCEECVPAVVVDVDATDPEGETEGEAGLVYSLSGPDADRFMIGPFGTLQISEDEGPGGGDVDGEPLEVTVTVTDSGLLTDTQSFEVTVAPPPEPDPPTAVDDEFTTDEDTDLDVDLTLNDMGVGVTVVPFSAAEPPAAITVTSDGGRAASVEQIGATTFVYFGADFDELGVGETDRVEFDYVVIDDNGLTDSATVVVTVDGTNDAPIAADDEATVAPGGSVVIAPLEGDTDPDTNDTLVVQSIDTTETAGVVTPGEDPNTFVYNPDGAFADPEDTEDSFVYTVSDGNGGIDTATVFISRSLTPEVAVADAFTVSKDETMFIGDVLANDIGENLFVRSNNEGAWFDVQSEGGRIGQVSLPGRGDFKFRSFTEIDGVLVPTFQDLNPGESDVVTLTYEITGFPRPPAAPPAVGTITITVLGITTNPELTNLGTAFLSIDVAPGDFSDPIIDVDATDPDGDTEGGGGLTYSLSFASRDELAIDADGVLTFAVANPADFRGFLVGVTVTDSSGLTDFRYVIVQFSDAG